MNDKLSLFVVAKRNRKGETDMPSQRFMRLPEEKRQVIWEAAMDEFLHQPFEKVSINRIIKEAGISRGSFYTYFEDKRELLSFLLRGTRERWSQACEESLKQSGGDFFIMMETLFDLSLELCMNNDLFNLHKNLIMYPDVQHEMMPAVDQCEEEIKRGIFEKVNRSDFRDPSPENGFLLFKAALAVMIGAVSEVCLRPEKVGQIRENYKKTLAILQYGACRESEITQTEVRDHE